MYGKLNESRFAIRFMMGCGLFLILCGGCHVVVYLMCDTSWAGPISWRKPILFGLSTGITLVSLSWVAGLIQPRKRDFLSFSLLGIFLVAEVMLITIQTWRSERSHFNVSSGLNSSLQLATELLITLSVVVIVDLTFRSLNRLPVQTDMKWAIRGGMSLLLAGCLIGFLILGIGYLQLSFNKAPETFGNNGVLKFPHGIPLHAIQILPLISWSAKRFGYETESRTTMVQIAFALVVAFTGFGLLQTFTGHSRFERWVGLYLYWGFAVVIVGAWFKSLRNQLFQPHALHLKSRHAEK